MFFLIFFYISVLLIFCIQILPAMKIGYCLLQFLGVLSGFISFIIPEATAMNCTSKYEILSFRILGIFLVNLQPKRFDGSELFWVSGEEGGIPCFSFFHFATSYVYRFKY